MNAGPRQVFVIRHAEKPPSDHPGSQGHHGHGPEGAAGVDETGTPSAHSLTPRGWQRAGALVSLFAPLDPGRGAPWAVVPTALLAPRHDSDRNGVPHRTTETVQPLARAVGVAVQAVREEGDEAALAADILGVDDGCVLVSWEHSHIRDVLHEIARLAHLAPLPSWLENGWPDERFDLVIGLRRVADQGPDGRSSYAVDVHPQLLLDGDRPAP